MSDALYERYKDALRRGHVAALRGRLDQALEAYAEAATVAPDRPLPHTSRGAVLVRLGRTAEALEAFDVALGRSARDEGALAGRAEVLATLGQRAAAAAAFDRLAILHEAAGRIAAACDAARRALELAESRGRRELVRELSDRLGASPLDAPARASLERALLALDPGSAAISLDGATGATGATDAIDAIDATEPDAIDATGAIDATDATEPAAIDATGAIDATDATEPAAIDATGAIDATDATEPAAGATGADDDGDAGTSPVAEVTPPGGSEPAGAAAAGVPTDAASSPAALEPDVEPSEPVPPPEPEEPRLPSRSDIARLTIEVERAMDARDASTARGRLLALARAYRALGSTDAALDACYLALSVAPDDTELHLQLVALYVDRGWRAPATEKLALLLRLTDLDGDGLATERVEAARSAAAAGRMVDQPG